MTTLKKPISRRTNTALSGAYGPDRGKHIVVTLLPGNGSTRPDLLTLRPERTRRAETISVEDVYAIALRSRARNESLEKARERKAKKQVQRERRRLESAERRLRRPLP